MESVVVLLLITHTEQNPKAFRLTDGQTGWSTRVRRNTARQGNDHLAGEGRSRTLPFSRLMGQDLERRNFTL
jgi:hypothetical protein